MDFGGVAKMGFMLTLKTRSDRIAALFTEAREPTKTVSICSITIRLTLTHFI